MAENPPPQNLESLTHRHKPGPSSLADNHEQHGNDHHIVPVSTYYIVIGLLMFLLIVTVGAAMLDLSHIWGPANIIIAMTIAVIKAGLILWYFMHLKFSSKAVRLFAGAGFMWLCIMFGLGLVDYFTRGWMHVG